VTIVGDEGVMAQLTSKQLRGLFFAIEVNLLLWLVVCGALWLSSSVEEFTKHVATGGMIAAALLQHWAYYGLYKRAKQAK